MAKKVSPIEIELQRAKEDLEDLEMYIEEFSAFLPLAVCAVNPVGIIIDINRAFEDLTGYKSIEIVGELLTIVFQEKKELEKMMDEISKKESVRGREFSVVSKKKEKIQVSVSASVRKDREGNFIGYFVGITDIAELKKLQIEMENKVKERTKELEKRTKELEESRTALMNMLEDVEESRKKSEEEKNKTLSIITNFSDGLLVFNKENKLSLINPQAEIFFNVQFKNVIGKSIVEFASAPALTPLTNLLGKEIRGIFRKELKIKENLVLEISSVPMMSNEEKLGVLVVLHDITREKLVERVKTEFVSLAAHQLRTPLAAIKWTLKMLLDGDLGEITPEQQEFIEKTYKSNERMISLINDLLDVTRIEEGRYLYKPALSNFDNVVHFVLNSHKDNVDRKNIKLEFKKIKTKIPRIIIDVEKMRVAVDNLLDNAVKYTPPGGKITVELDYLKKTKEIEFKIQDTGVGIPSDQKGRVFTKFFRGANVMRMDTEGSGLGIFISKNIIEAHGGKIWFESEENKGTTFHFTLPVKEEFTEFLKEF